MKYFYKTAIILLLISLTQVNGALANSLGVRVLHEPMKGDDVKELQQYLQILGFEVEVDGVFGPTTGRVIREFQRSVGLRIDGIVGRNTLDQLATRIVPPIIHIVQPGETLSHIAQQHGTSIAQIREQNVIHGDLIRIGQKLLITEEEAFATGLENRVYHVQSGDTLSGIADKFRVSQEVLMTTNNLANPNLLWVGQEILVPEMLSSFNGGLDSLIWPVHGRITSPFGTRTHPIYKTNSFHGGLDIAAPLGTPVRAAATGVVVQSEPMGGFGLGIVIDHGNGATTLYGHNSELLVAPGDLVRQGDVIAKVGSTGVSTGPHLDFRIKINGTPVDPSNYLP